ncbi:MAG: DegV family EDD domain-containing protein [Lachnospiraceae bacterium]|nr:DegV family EDD domain-containing protein [Lachnospiraceae bacterium]
MGKIILVAESGSDISKDIASEYGIYIAPMHVAFGDETVDDGSFPVQKICDFYDSTGKLPKTSGSTPDDFYTVFDEIHEKYPDAHILYLAYSAVTTCAYQSAMIAGEGRDYITAIDTKQVSIGQGIIVVEMAKLLKANPDITLEEAVEKANDLIDRANMCFAPNDLEFLRAGGRVSNVAFLGSKILNLHPCIELLEGKLVATKKYRGKMIKVASQLVKDYAENYNLDRECLWCVYTIGLSEEVMAKVEYTADECGFKTVEWIQANGVITTHGGPAAFGLAGFSKELQERLK